MPRTPTAPIGVLPPRLANEAREAHRFPFLENGRPENRPPLFELAFSYSPPFVHSEKFKKKLLKKIIVNPHDSDHVSFCWYDPGKLKKCECALTAARSAYPSPNQR